MSLIKSAPAQDRSSALSNGHIYVESVPNSRATCATHHRNRRREDIKSIPHFIWSEHIYSIHVTPKSSYGRCSGCSRHSRNRNRACTHVPHEKVLKSLRSCDGTLLATIKTRVFVPTLLRDHRAARTSRTQGSSPVNTDNQGKRFDSNG